MNTQTKNHVPQNATNLKYALYVIILFGVISIISYLHELSKSQLPKPVQQGIHGHERIRRDVEKHEGNNIKKAIKPLQLMPNFASQLDFRSKTWKSRLTDYRNTKPVLIFLNNGLGASFEECLLESVPAKTAVITVSYLENIPFQVIQKTIDSCRNVTCKYIIIATDPLNSLANLYKFCTENVQDRRCKMKHDDWGEITLESLAKNHKKYFLRSILTLVGYCDKNEYSTLCSKDKFDDKIFQSFLKEIHNSIAIVGLTEHAKQTLGLLGLISGLDFAQCLMSKRNFEDCAGCDSKITNDEKNVIVSNLEHDRLLYEELTVIYRKEMSKLKDIQSEIFEMGLNRLGNLNKNKNGLGPDAARVKPLEKSDNVKKFLKIKNEIDDGKETPRHRSRVEFSINEVKKTTKQSTSKPRSTNKDKSLLFKAKINTGATKLNNTLNVANVKENKFENGKAKSEKDVVTMSNKNVATTSLVKVQN